MDLTNFRDNANLRYAAKHFRESGIAFHGDVFTHHYRKGDLIHFCNQGPNTFTTEGMARILNIVFRAQATEAAIYCGIFKNNVSPAVGDTATAKLGAAGTYGECQDADYDSPATNKPAYTIAAAGSGSCTNAASAASFTIAGSITVYGAFLGTGAAKTDTTGKLMCAKKFTTARAVVDNDVLACTYIVSCTTS